MEKEHIVVKVFENPYDLENVLQSMEIASTRNLEIVYLDRLITSLRNDESVDLLDTSYKILNKLDLIEIKNETMKGIYHG